MANCPPTFARRVLTFNLHYLIGVLHHLVLGLIAEGVSPGLDKVQDLTADTCLHLPLHRKGRGGKTKKNLRKRPWNPKAGVNPPEEKPEIPFMGRETSEYLCEVRAVRKPQ